MTHVLRSPSCPTLGHVTRLRGYGSASESVITDAVVAHFRLIVGGPRKILKNQFLVTATDALLTIDPDAQTRVLYRTLVPRGDAPQTMRSALQCKERSTPARRRHPPWSRRSPHQKSEEHNRRLNSVRRSLALMVEPSPQPISASHPRPTIRCQEVKPADHRRRTLHVETI